MAKKRIFILGAGLAGLSTAWYLQRKGIDCCIFEKESEVGGLCRSKKIRGFTFDCDGHLLHFKHRYTFNLIKGLLKDNLVKHRRSAWVYAFDTYIRYPFQANLYGLPISVVEECLIEFIRALRNGQFKKKKDLNFFEWANLNFGKGIVKHFLIPYNTKFWTVSPKELSCAWLDGFIPIPTLKELVEGTIHESKRQFGYNANFWYPKIEGINQVPLALASQVKNIHTNCEITEINLSRREVKIISGNKEKYDFLISTIPLPELPRLIKGLPEEIMCAFKRLRWNSIFNLNIGIDKKDYLRRHWIYFPCKDICFFRVGFFHNFSSHIAPSNKSSLYVEVSYSKDKPIDKNNIISHIKKDLKKVGIITSEDRIDVQDINDIKYGYPIYDKNYQDSRERILKFLIQNNILPCGRYGSWRYMSMEESMLDGRNAVKQLNDII